MRSYLALKGSLTHTRDDSCSCSIQLYVTICSCLKNDMREITSVAIRRVYRWWRMLNSVRTEFCYDDWSIALETSSIWQITFFSLFKGPNVIAYLPSNVSFSIRDQRDIVQLTIPFNQEFDSYEILIRTRSSTGFLTSFYSSADQRTLSLSLFQGRLQIHYERPRNVTTKTIFSDYRTINDGQPHRISLQRSPSPTTAALAMHLQIDQFGSSISIPDRSPLSFDQVTIGGLSRSAWNHTFVGCVANVIYNHQPLLSRETLSSDRYGCAYQQDSMCDRRTPCSTRTIPFCGERDCALVCQGIFSDIHKRGLVRYYSRIGSSPNEEISLMVFTTSSNATLLLTLDGPIQVSIILQVPFIQLRSVLDAHWLCGVFFKNFYPQLLIRNEGLVDTYAFPDRLQAGRWSRIELRKTLQSVCSPDGCAESDHFFCLPRSIWHWTRKRDHTRLLSRQPSVSLATERFISVAKISSVTSKMSVKR